MELDRILQAGGKTAAHERLSEEKPGSFCLSNWFKDPFLQARRIIQERIQMEAAVRKAEVHENTHALPNPDRDSDGIQVPPLKKDIDREAECRVEGAYDYCRFKT